jgi:hypothetical protein
MGQGERSRMREKEMVQLISMGVHLTGMYEINLHDVVIEIKPVLYH